MTHAHLGALYRCVRIKAEEIKKGDFLFSNGGDFLTPVKKVVIDTPQALQNRPQMISIFTVERNHPTVSLWLDTLVTILQPIRVVTTKFAKEPNETKSEGTEDPSQA